MIQFNLLPDVKLEYIRAQRLKRTIVTIATIAGGASLLLLIMLVLVVDVFQKTHLHGLNSEIKANSAKLQSIPDLAKVLTIQNQIGSLSCTQQELQQGQKPCLHDKKPVTSRLFGYLKQIVPSKVSISDLTVDFDLHTIVFTGSADSLKTVNTFVDTLKFTTWQDNSNAFTNVVLTSFGRTPKGSTYVINVSFAPQIFDSSQNIKLTVPNQVTTRSETEKPTDLFKIQPSDSSNNQTGP